jgi:hypothetical protein
MKSEPKGALNIRGFPKDLIWKCKQKAAEKKMTLAEFVIWALRSAISEGRKNGV